MIKVCVPVTEQEQVDPRWGRAQRVAVVEAGDDGIQRWQVFDVGWDRLHDEGTEGSHHARVVRFLRTHEIEMVVAAHMGAPMQNTLRKMGLRVVLDAAGDARSAVGGTLS
ncbi:NifB/NifX family molybdenum-iron cluster-binding protein [Actinoplanes sp. NPDC049802]|uniref:NifB/NifX family molybdenum-iron cluster-binding protein n=1 Tax=Actinoplanes sp. NPDC049802 TaxID=3154742 RepID=UPI0033EE1F1B